MTSLTQMLQETPYVSYTYAYPHKTAYRLFPRPIPLSEIWSEEKRDALFLYMHVPFCEMRCGFCNLFTTVDPHARFASGYLTAIEHQAQQVRESIGPVRIARMAIGGGTPTNLSITDLDQLFTLATRYYDVAPGSVPTSVETSPLTADRDKLHLLHDHGVDRISIGIQSFLEHEANAAGRPQQRATVEQALTTIRDMGFPTLNIDLIYGLPGQTVQSWLESLRIALSYQPEELYLYPLYVRPLTGLARRKQPATPDVRLQCYRQGRELLLEAGYTQVSMRMFRAAHASAKTGPVYCAQDDGMIGLGCGARSYTHAYQYSNEYAVGAQGVREILAHYIATPPADFAFAHYGFHLNEDEQSRRYILKSLLEEGEMDLTAYQHRFGDDALQCRPELHELQQMGLTEHNDFTIKLTTTGLERSDTIGPWLYSTEARTLMEGFILQ